MCACSEVCDYRWLVLQVKLICSLQVQFHLLKRCVYLLERRWKGDFPDNKVDKQHFLSFARFMFQYSGTVNNFIFISK